MTRGTFGAIIATALEKVAIEAMLVLKSPFIIKIERQERDM